MYNRYIPQPDGSYRRSRIQEPPQPSRPSPPPPPPCSPPPPCREPEKPESCPPPKPHKPPRQEDSALSFLQSLLPGGLDRSDLLVIVLLLLMAGDCREDRNHALLTLAIYLFL